MPQFLLGFWMGCVLTAWVCCALFYCLRRKKEKTEEAAATAEEGKTEKKEVPFFVPTARVLLVDDSKLSRRLIKDYLKDTGIEFIEAESGSECIAKIKKESFDLIFMDWNMPGTSGLETLEYLQKEMRSGTKVPVVVMGSNVRQENTDEYLTKGFAGCLAKPIQGNRLEELVRKLLPEHLLVQKPEGFSYQNGLKNFDGNEEMYRETLLLFSSLWEERREQLYQFLQEENMQEYAVLIHAIKGDARILGADILAKLAYEQELSAKAGDTDAVRNSYERVIKVGTKTAEYFLKSYSA